MRLSKCRPIHHSRWLHNLCKHNSLLQCLLIYPAIYLHYNHQCLTTMINTFPFVSRDDTEIPAFCHETKYLVYLYYIHGSLATLLMHSNYIMSQRLQVCVSEKNQTNLINVMTKYMSSCWVSLSWYFFEKSLQPLSYQR